MSWSNAVFAVLTGVMASVLPLDAAQAAPTCRERESGVVRTLPAVPGFEFRLGGQTFRTGVDGTVWVPGAAFPCRGPVAKAAEAVGEVIPLGEGVVARFHRWQAATEDSPAVAAATFTTERTVSFRFTNPEGSEVDRASLGMVRIKGSTGGLYEVGDPASIVLPASRVVRLNGGLLEKDLYYSVERVDVNGNSVVNRSQIRFVPAERSVVDVPLLYNSLSVRAVDSFFGTPTGSTLLVAYPDGKVERHGLDADGRVVLPRLPRGDYQLQVIAPGLKLWRPIAMSKPQDVELKVLTYLDIGVVLSVLAAIALGLLVLGIRARRRHRLSRPRPAHLRPVDATMSG